MDSGKLQDTQEPEYRKTHIRSIDRSIREHENAIGFLTAEIKWRKNKLQQLKKVRKLVTPKDEAKIAVMREVGLI